jgi:DNA polymerase III delta' subunit
MGMGFDSVLGNSRVKRILRLALQKDRLPNSLLFYGTEGVGKRRLAVILAQAVNCERRRDDACGECPSCVAIRDGRFPDVQVVEPSGQVIKIEQLRDVRQAAYMRPMSGRKRAFIISEAHRMKEESSNTMLKILEEPPLFSHLILVTENPHLILPTIKSRCQALQFVPIGREEIARALLEKGLPEDQAKILSLYVRGNLEEALDLNWDDVQAGRREAWDLFNSIIKPEKPALFLSRYGFVQRNFIRDGLKRTLETMASLCRDLVLVKDRGDLSLLLNPDYEEGFQALEKGCGLERCWEFMRRVEEAVSGLDKNLNMNLIACGFHSLLGEDAHERDHLSRL